MTNQVKYHAQGCVRKSAQFLFAISIALAATRAGHAQVRFSRTSNRGRESNGLYLLGGIEFNGLPYNYKFQQQGNVLQRGWVFPDGTNDTGFGLSCSLALHYRLSDRFAIETGMQLSEMDLMVNDKRFMNKIGIKGSDPMDNFSRTEVNSGNFDAVNWYRSNYISGYYFVPSQSRTNLYFSGGVAANFLTGPINMTGNYYYPCGKENLELTTHYKPFYINSFVETGICFNPRNSSIIFLGLKYYFAGKIVSGDYRDIQNGVVAYRDHADSDGSYLSLTLKVGGLISPHEKKEPLQHHTGSPPLMHRHSKAHHPHYKPKAQVHHKSKSKKQLGPIPKTGPNTRGW